MTARSIYPPSGSADAGISEPFGLPGSADAAAGQLSASDAGKFAALSRPAALADAESLWPQRHTG